MNPPFVDYEAPSCPDAPRPSICKKSMPHAVTVVYEFRSGLPYDIMSKRTTKEGVVEFLAGDEWEQLHAEIKGINMFLYQNNALHKQKYLLPLLGMHAILLSETVSKSKYLKQHVLVLYQVQACRKLHVLAVNSQEDALSWLCAIKSKHNFSGPYMPRRISLPPHNITMELDSAVRALQTSAISPRKMPIAQSIKQSSNKKSDSLIKSTVSKKKRRFVSDGFDLDLTYITNRIIAMGFPASGTESVYRNDMSEVQRFLELRHPFHYRVYNLCSERRYDPICFHNRVMEFPFDDHNCPAFEDLIYFCKDATYFLSLNLDNIIVVHCKAGKGRTGVMIAILMLYLGIWETADDALRYYAIVRTYNQKGVTIASQIRWVHMFEQYVKLSIDGLKLPPLQRKTLLSMRISSKAPTWSYFIADNHGELLDSRNTAYRMRKEADGFVIIECGEPWAFTKDFQIEFYRAKVFGKDKRIFSFWLHTQFFEDALTLHKQDIDKVNKQKHLPDFTIDLSFVVSGYRMSLSTCKMNDMLATCFQMEQYDFVGQFHIDRMLLHTQNNLTAQVQPLIFDNNTLLPEFRDVLVYVGEYSQNDPAPAPRLCEIKKDSVYALYWCQKNQPFEEASSILLHEIDKLIVGPQDHIWQANTQLTGFEDRALTVVAANGRKLHLLASDERQRSNWVEGLLEICAELDFDVLDRVLTNDEII